MSTWPLRRPAWLALANRLRARPTLSTEALIGWAALFFTLAVIDFRKA